MRHLQTRENSPQSPSSKAQGQAWLPQTKLFMSLGDLYFLHKRLLGRKGYGGIRPGSEMTLILGSHIYQEQLGTTSKIWETKRLQGAEMIIMID